MNNLQTDLFSEQPTPVAMTREVTITSLEIAEIAKARHSDVIRSIELLISQGLKGYTPKADTYQNPQNKQIYKIYVLNKRDAMVSISGFRADVRAAIIDRLVYLESQLKHQIPQTYAEALLEAGRLALENEQLQLQMQKQQPLVEFAENVAASVNAISIGEFAKLLGIKNMVIL